MGNSSRDHYGSWIRDTRQGKGMSIEEASTATNIDRQYLRALETGNIALLPEPYMRAFLKTYAGFLGLDPADVLRRFEVFLREESESLDVLKDTIREREGRKSPAIRQRESRASEPPRGMAPVVERQRSTSHPPRRTRSFAVPAVIILVAVGLLAVFGSPGIMNEPSGSGGDEEVPEVVDDTNRSGDEAARSTEPRYQVDPDPTTLATATLEFTAEALEDTWMQAIADGDTVVSRIVTEGRQVEVTFRDTLEVKIGKNHGMRLLFNGEELTDLGPEGMILSFLLTVDGMRQRRLTYPPETIPDFLNIPPGS
ncbi:helix-turn-helix domain-containing protein [Gemmatimonadota bacterium]